MRYAIVVLLLLTSGVIADDWRGFHGLEKQGLCDSSGALLTWSPTENIKWKAAIPGRGHSSPVVSGDHVYVTSTYESARLFWIQSFWNYAVFGLTLLVTVTGLRLGIQALGVKRKKVDGAWLHARVFMFTAWLVGIVVMVLFGRHLLELDDRIIRSWVTSTMLVLCCLLFGPMLVPLRSRLVLVAGLFSVFFAAPTFIAFRQKGIVFAWSSLKGVVLTGVLALPLVLGLVLVVMFYLSRRRGTKAIHCHSDSKLGYSVMWRSMLTVGVGLVAALVPFLVIFCRDAEYKMSDYIIWHCHLKSDVSWWCIGLFVVLSVLAVARCCFRAVSGDLKRNSHLQGVFVIAAMALGASFFININYVRKPTECIRAVTCLSRNSGDVLWACEALIGQAKGKDKYVTYASATPVTDGECVYGYFGGDGLVSVSSMGDLLWKIPGPMFKSQCNVGTSPIVADSTLLVVSDVRKPDDANSSILSAITAYDCVTGKRLWERARQSLSTYNTPLVRTLNGMSVVLVQGSHDIRGYDLKTGHELWSHPIAHEGRHLIASMVSDDECLYAMGEKRIWALDLRKFGTGDDPLVWSQALAGRKSSTPVVAHGLVLGITENGLAFCVEAQTGEVLWQERLKGRYYSSVIAMGDQVLFTSEAGETTVAAIGGKFQQMALNSLDGRIYASLAPTESELFIRTTEYLYCIQADEGGKEKAKG
jgi:outer membrane protein assembly factor BamB